MYHHHDFAPYSKNTVFSKKTVFSEKMDVSEKTDYSWGRKLLIWATGLFLFCACSSFSLILVINSRSLYHALLSLLDIPATSGFSREEILLNYNHLIDYCSPFFRGDLVFPTFHSSASAISHFAEVKEIFMGFYFTLIISGALSFFAMRMLTRPERKYAARLAGLACLLVPAFFLCLFFAGFQGKFHQAFLSLHGILFQNMDWLFDPATDPVILILPEKYFFCCGILFLLFLCIAGLLLCRRSRQEQAKPSWLLPAAK